MKLTMGKFTIGTSTSGPGAARWYPAWMRTATLSVSVALSVLLIAGCQDQAADEGERIAALLAPVPADTPYLAASLHYLPEDVYQHQMKLLAPPLAELVDTFGTAVTIDTPKTNPAEQQKGRAFFAALSSYLRDESRWEQHRGVLYGVGLFPVLRVELSDPEATLQDLQKLHQDMGTTPQVAADLGATVFKVIEEGEPVGLYYGVTGDYFIATVVPTGDSDVLALAFGNTPPAAALDPATLEQLAQQRGYGPGVLGYVDTLKTYDALMDKSSGLLARVQEQVGAAEAFDLDAISAECRAELRDMMALMPRLDWGSTRMDKAGMASSSYIQLRQDVAEGLLAMTGDVTGLDQDPGSEIAFAASFRVGPARDFLLRMARNIQADPFQCEHLLALNMGADGILAQAGRPIPPFVGQVRGFKMRMDGVAAMEAGQPPEMSLALFVDNAQLLMSMMQLFLPQLAETPLPADGTPVRIDQQLGDMVPQDQQAPIFAALTESAIGVSMGQPQADHLPAMMTEADGGEAGILFASWVDYGAILEMQRRLEAKRSDGVVESLEDDDMSMEDMAEAFDGEGDDGAQAGDDVAGTTGDEALADADSGEEAAMDEEIRALYEAQTERVMEKLLGIYEVLGRAGSVMRPTAGGLVIEQEISFKEP